MRSRNTGFSLIELMITVAIMGILSAIAVPAYQNYITKAKTVDLMTASHMGQLMVAEYIQTTSAPDCTAMPGQDGNGNVAIPISSANISAATIGAQNNGYGPCAVIVAGWGSGARFISQADQLGWIPEIQMASYDSMTLENDAIPNVQLAFLGPAGGLGGGLGRVPSFVRLFSIPIFNQDGSISWTVYSNGAAGAPASLPIISNLLGGTTGSGTTGDPSGGGTVPTAK
jgi:prepilin-type N-terminal cleavage/methylation domain-containing protein